MEISKRYDKMIVIPALILLLYGLLMIYSATYKSEIGFFYKQSIWAALSIAIFVFIQYTPLKVFYISSYLIFGLSIALLVLLKIMNASYVERWIDIGIAYIQPSEFAKIATILALGKYLSNMHRDVNKLKVLLMSTLIILIPFLLVFIQPDLGTSLIFIALLVFMLYLADVREIYIFALITPVLSILLSFVPILWVIYLFLVCYIFYLFKMNILNIIKIGFLNIIVGGFAPYFWSLMKDYQKVRLLSFLSPQKDIHGYGWNLLQSKIAVGSGGFWGNGFLKGTQKGLDFVPQQHTDFIFSVIAEEFGFFGFLIILVLLVMIFARVAFHYPSIRSRYSKLLAGGILTTLTLQIFLNIAMTIGLIPIVGIPLNFISYGGSSLITTAIMIGLLNRIMVERSNYW